MLWLQTAVLLLAAPTSGDVVLLDFYTDGCMPCRRMVPTLDQLSAQGYPIRRINGGRNQAAAARYRVSAFPTFILIADGREIDRVVGYTSYDRLAKMFTKAAALKAQMAENNAPAPIPTKMPSSVNGAEGSLPVVASGPMNTGQDSAMVPVADWTGPNTADASLGWAPISRPSHNIQNEQNFVRPASFTQELANTPEQPLSTVSANGTSPVTNAQLIASTVRLRIEDPNGHSCGTGTLIDARDGWALILTCGHLFRDSKGNGKIDIDLFGPEGQQRVAGELVYYDSEKRDLGLVRIRIPGRICVAPIAPRGYQIALGAPVASVGCSNGADPTVARTRIRSKNKFVGPPNLQTDGLPVEGRSGGGLFSTEGYVIGVCNAADPTDNAGLFAALESIHAELDRIHLSYVYQRPSGRPTGRWSPAAIESPDNMVAVAPPAMPAKMPAPVSLADTNAQGPIPTSSRHTAPQGYMPSAAQAMLTPEEAAALEEIRRRKREGAEVICIIRSPNDPSGKSEILRLDRASNAFLEQLDAEAGSNAVQPLR